MLVELTGRISDYAINIDHLAQQLAATRVEKPPGDLPVRYSQNDQRWANVVYADSLTFAQAGGYVCCVSMLATWGGSNDTPVETAAKLKAADCFIGDNLSKPQNIPDAYSFMEWPDDAYWNRSGDRAPDDKLQFIRDSIVCDGPLILRIDQMPTLRFVLAVGVVGDANLEIIDPIDGYRGALSLRYGDPQAWSISQAVYGYRRLRVKM